MLFVAQNYYNLCFPWYVTVLDNQITLSLHKIFLCVKMKFIPELLESRKSNKGRQ